MSAGHSKVTSKRADARDEPVGRGLLHSECTEVEAAVYLSASIGDKLPVPCSEALGPILRVECPGDEFELLPTWRCISSKS